MTTEDKGGKPIDPKELKLALEWNDPDALKLIEEDRYPVQRALSKVIGNVFMQHIPQGASIYEVGAGQGYLKDLIPTEYHTDYVSSDFNIDNLRAGQKRRELTIERASATDLPLADNSKDCIVNMDVYDNLPDLQSAMNEAQRVLKPGGKFIHIQVNYPSDDIVSYDYPGYIFFPPRIGEFMQQHTMIGVKREDLITGISYITTPLFKEVIQDLLVNREEALIDALSKPDPKTFSALLNDLLDAMPIDKLAISSLPDYLRTKLERTLTQAGLTIVESGFRSTSIRAPRAEIHATTPQSNEFSMENGIASRFLNAELGLSQSTDIIEKATVLVFVAQKPQAK